MNIILVTIAQNQTTFFKLIAQQLLEDGHTPIIITFHEQGIKDLKTICDIDIYNVHAQFETKRSSKKEDLIHIAKALNISDINEIFVHEQYCYELKTKRSLEDKTTTYYYALEKIFENICKKYDQNDLALFQELGGFISVQMTNLVAQKNGIDNFFIEPSFFRGRVFFTKNSLSAPIITHTSQGSIPGEVENYLRKNLEQKEIVVPKKDLLRYKPIYYKFLNLHNLRRIIEKTIDKYICKRKEEFQHIWVYVRKHIRMLINGIRLKKFYQELPQNTKYIYFPLHVPADFALTVRSFEYIDQYSILEYLSKKAPYGTYVLFKEHPALIGGVNYNRVKTLLTSNENILLLNPSTNNFDAMKYADAIVTINSKSGAEAISMGKKCIVLGDAFYKNTNLSYSINHIKELSSVLKNIDSITLNKPEDIKRYFSDVWYSSYPGEVFYNDQTNVKEFINSIYRVLKIT
jgi:capsule polysaccharide modification protein KpsS